MEEIGEGLLRVIWSAIRWLLWHFVFHIVLFNLGRFFLLIVTFGNYPKGHTTERDIDKISLAGVYVVVLVWVGIAIYNNYV